MMEKATLAADELTTALGRLNGHADEIFQWGFQLAWSLTHDGRLYTAGNGGSAAHAQLLAAELVERMRDEREQLPAFALDGAGDGDGSTVTALSNDYGHREVFARQVRAQAGPGDVVLMLSTGGSSPNCVGAAEAALEKGAEPWALTGPLPNPLAPLCKRVIAVDTGDTHVVQEVHQMLVHLLCECVDELLPTMRPSGAVA